MGSKKYALFIIILGLLFASPVLAKPLLHKIAVLPTLEEPHILCVEYEGRTSMTNSIIWRGYGLLTPASEASSFGLGSGVRYYPQRDALRGLYITPSLETIWSFTENPESKTIKGDFSANLALGYQLVIGNMLSLDLSGGFAIPFYSLTADNERFNNEFSYSLVPIYKLGAGFVW